MTLSEKENTSIDRLNAALAHQDVSWGFFQMLDATDREIMDQLLVEIGHDVAFEAGNKWHRFATLHKAGFRFPDTLKT